MDGRALLFVGPDGSGRFTLAEAMGITFQIPRVVSYTTRPQRGKETEGKEYYFVTSEEFIDIENKGEFIEVVQADGYHYGIKKSDCERLLNEAGSFFAILSPEGCEIFRNLFEKNLTIFVYADKETVIQRQRDRGDDEVTIDRHISHYEQIMDYQSKCDIVIPNYDLASTAQELTNRIEQFLNLTYHPDSKY
ncbi:guanylate kinase [Ammoniphilus sp. CFH 90114]|uniref:guanylate kinase n=1 Tax=Ammoniphilus sp. CFH 90114 TaxID=2493665 RepID=UPI00100F98B8|nr:guanylate kinase [Ammoniphilus sp. CFH 90114]RXT07795.1 guanylate kinase [Ammoniphilus sp. CFH 90114]